MKTVRRDALRPGDHIFSDRTMRLYFHHGIYVGDDMVIHLTGPSKGYNRPPCKRCGFKPQAGIIKTCLDCFLEGHSLYRYEYDVSYLELVFKRRGSCSTWDCKPAEQVVKAAYRLLQDKSFGSYNFFLNNCEDFAVYCKTGVAMSNQTSGLFGFNLAGVVGYAVTKAIHDDTDSVTLQESENKAIFDDTDSMTLQESVNKAIYDDMDSTTLKESEGREVWGQPMEADKLDVGDDRGAGRVKRNRRPRAK